ncbi:hypothetical protein BS47DRAFT_1264041, partial [Hydnum rufescens UP504]
PSAYLQSCCALCFGGRHAADLQATVIVCIDANFQLKCNHDKDWRKGFEGQTGAWDPEIFSPRTVELLQADLDDMAARINEVQPTKSPAGAGRKRKADELVEDDRNRPCDDDSIEPGMNIPNSVLDTCGDSFIAADGDHIKASTQCFDDTGLMAMLC